MIECTRCVMDTSDPRIVFDSDGVCDHCKRAAILLERLPSNKEESERRVSATFERIQSSAPSDEYQCLVGLSGGVDSSYVLLLARRHGLRCLAVHFDNGWNSEVAVSNIKKLCHKLDVDLMTYVINWEEFRDLQVSFLKASVVDVELVTDHAIFAAILTIAKQNKIRYVLSGANFATESILPSAWVWPKQDRRNIEGIHRRFGTVELRTFPRCGPVRWGLMRSLHLGAVFLEPLNEIAYSRRDAISDLETAVGWSSYGAKHHESTFTKWYQCFLLPRKFHIDKRRAHLSSLIMNGEISRSEAVVELASEPYSAQELAEEHPYVLKKLRLNAAEFEEIMALPPRAHDSYPSSRLLPLISWAGLAQRSSRDSRR